MQYGSSHARVTSSGGRSLGSKLKAATPTASAAIALGDAQTIRPSLSSNVSPSAPALCSSPTRSTPKAQCATPVAAKPVPVTVTFVPPAALPLTGEMELTVGAS